MAAKKGVEGIVTAIAVMDEAPMDPMTLAVANAVSMADVVVAGRLIPCLPEHLLPRGHHQTCQKICSAISFNPIATASS